ncbi:Blue-light-activated protein [Boseongicola aestuarii]|uniref:histidine kinase n=1 Tax=Boseongicola aestuarii TaxID=1470561 RepID=A0A238IUZ3_9RHOB|nr:Blue-light-activated protein [Boseongicola aestuarii]
MAETTTPDADAPFLSVQAVRPFPLIVLSALTLMLALAGPPGAAMIGALGAGAGLIAAAVILWVLAIRDGLTGRKRGRNLLGEARSDPAPVLLGDISGRITFANAAALEALHLGPTPPRTVSDALGALLADPDSVTGRILHQTEHHGHAQEDIRTAQTQLRLRARNMGPTEGVWRIEAIPVTDKKDVGRGAEKPAQDQGPKGYTSVDKGHSHLPTLTPDVFEGLPVPILNIATDGAIPSANLSARKLLTLGADDLPPLYDLVEGMGRPIAEWLTDAANGRGLMKTEFVRAVRPGQELFLQIALGRREVGDDVQLIGVLNDATELKSLEAQFVQSQKMQAIGQLAGGVAHDFNNLLTAISGHCDLLLLRHNEGDPEFMDLMQIAQNANRAASLVGQLLAFSRKQNLKPQPLDLRDTMSDLTHLLNRLVGE